MEETTGSELEKIFRKFEDEVKERTKKEKEAKQEVERFGKEFTCLKKDVIRPTMEEVGAYIKKFGHEYYIMESESMISMDIVPSTTYRGAPEQPSITFHGWSTHIDISKRPPLYTYASDEKAKIEDITKSFVEENIVDAMKNWERTVSK